MLNGNNCSKIGGLMMLKSFYEHEKTNKSIYDGVREYCRIEQVNEEYFRNYINKHGLGSKPIKKCYYSGTSTKYSWIWNWLTQN